MTIRLFLGLSLLNALSLHGATASTTATPAGWHVKAAPADASVAQLSDEALIDALVSTTSSGDRSPSPIELDVFLPLATAPHFPVMTEIVRRGFNILPAVLSHLSDTRPTQVVLDPKRLRLNGTGGIFTEVYDYRFRENGPRPTGVNVRPEKTAPRGQWPYTVKVGDLCFVALGQIVNRRLFVSGPDFGNGMMFSGAFSLSINSPVETPALAAAARADWGSLNREQFIAHLKDDAAGAGDASAKKVGEWWRPPLNRIAAFQRLLFYFPTVGAELVAAQFNRPLVHWALPETKLAPEAPQTNDGEATGLITMLAPFAWDGLNTIIHALYQRAVDEEQKVIVARPPTGRLASTAYDLPLACARRLLHQNHDDEFRAFFTAAVERAEREYPIVYEKRKDDINKRPSVFANAPANFPGAELDRKQKDFEIQSLAIMLREPIEARTKFLKELGPSAR